MRRPSVNNFGKNFALWIIIGLLLLALFNLFQTSGGRSSPNQVPYSDLVRAVEQKDIRNATVQGDQITGNYTDGRTFTTTVPSGSNIADRMADAGVSVQI